MKYHGIDKSYFCRWSENDEEMSNL